MPYIIKHKSRDLCLIKYVRGKKFGRILWKDTLIAVLALTAMVMRVPVFLCIVVAGYALWRAHSHDGSETPEFEIKLNRKQNLISVNYTESSYRKPVTYNLSSLIGFTVRETLLRRRSKTFIRAELMFKIAPAYFAGLTREVPVINRRYYVSPENAADIIAATDKWLKPEDQIAEIQAPEIPTQEEVIRDFRDIEESEIPEN